MKRLIYIFCLLTFTTLGYAQTYSYLGVKDGLSHRSIYSIEKDSKGYMWFLTHEGADRYNGSEFKHYNFFDGATLLNSAVHLNNLFHVKDGKLWQIGPDGRAFYFNEEKDAFELAYVHPKVANENVRLNFGYVDDSSIIWMGYNKGLVIYDYNQKKEISIPQQPLYEVTTVVQLAESQYAIGTTNGFFFGKIKDSQLNIESMDKSFQLTKPIDVLHYHDQSNTLIASTRSNEVYVIDMVNKTIQLIPYRNGLSISRIIDFSAEEVLIATNGSGVVKLDLRKREMQRYIYADYDTNYDMNGNNIRDIYIDEGNRIWMANYPSGVTIRYNTNLKLSLIQHKINNRQSLVHNEVNAIYEDADGDIWFATNNGISLYRTKQKKWDTYLSTYNNDGAVKNHTYYTICEVKPGVVWVGALYSGSFEINKNTNQYKQLDIDNPSPLLQVDKQIKSIYKDNEGVWLGGYYSLRHVDLSNMQIRYYNNISAITDIEGLDEDKLWVATSKGLYLLDKRTGAANQIDLPIENSDIKVLLQYGKDTLYIGTSEGLLVLNISSGKFDHFTSRNSLLLSNTIMSLVEDKSSKHIFVATDSQIMRFNTDTQEMRHWTKDQGLLDTFFSINAGLQQRNGNIIFGTIDGAIAFDPKIDFVNALSSKLVFESFAVNQKEINPDDKSGILSATIDETSKIILNYTQNNIAIKVGSINYDSPSNMLYSWKLEGVYDEWSKPEKENNFVFTNLAPYRYVFKVRVSYSDNPDSILDEREMYIRVLPPFWWGIGAKMFYIILLVSGIVFVVIYVKRESEKRLVDHTKRFYFNTAHDMQVPLKLIKEPLQELKDTEELSAEGQNNIKIVLRNLNLLLSQNNNALSYEKMDKNSNKLYLSEHHLSSLVEGLVKQVDVVAEIKQVNINLRDTLDPNLRIWIDLEKVKAILNYLLNSILELTYDFKSINIILGVRSNEWFLEFTYEGELLPFECDIKDKEDEYIDKAIHGNEGIGKSIGSRLVCKLLKIYRGQIDIKSIGKSSVFIELNLPIYQSAVAEIAPVNTNEEGKPDVGERDSISKSPVQPTQNIPFPLTIGASSSLDDPRTPLILLAETDELIISEIKQHLSGDYNIEVISTGEEVIDLAKKRRPALILSKMQLEDNIKGVDLAVTLKSLFETSHIPIVLLTDKNDEKYILKGLENGADEFILKPFNYQILKATIANILSNRALLRDRYANLEMEEEAVECLHCSSNLDWKFISAIQKNVEDHMSEPDFTVDKLCAIMNMSRTSFYNKLKDLTNKTPSDYIRVIKLNKAAKLLLEKELTITEIAEQTGFNDAKYFREVFKKHFNTTPSKYAK